MEAPEAPPKNATELRKTPVRYLGGARCGAEDGTTSRRCRQVVVLARLKEGLSWIPKEALERFQFAVYSPPLRGGSAARWGNGLVLNSRTLNSYTPFKGREEPKYLAYLIQAYDDLPDQIMFLHAHARGGHEAVFEQECNRTGRIAWQWWKAEIILGFPWEETRCVKAFPTLCNCFSPGPPATASADDGDAASSGSSDSPARPEVGEHEAAAVLTRGWSQLFEPEFGALWRIGARVPLMCCGQFVVSRAGVRAHPKAFYERLYSLVTEDVQHAMVMEHAWRLIFSVGCEAAYSRQDACKELDNTRWPHFRLRPEQCG